MVRRHPLRSLSFTVVAAIALASWACGDPDSDLRALSAGSPSATVSASATAGDDTPTSEPGTTDTPEPVVATRTPAPAASVAATASIPPTTDVPATTAPAGTATIPPPCRDLTFDTSATLTNADLLMRGAGSPVHAPFLGTSLVIRKIGVDAPFVVHTVPPSGRMPDPDSATVVAWYDFSGFVGLGGTPGTDTGNVVIAGNYDYINTPQSVFFRLSELVPGDLIQINTSDGRTLAYAVEFNKTTAVDAIDWQALVTATPEESVTLITAAAAHNEGRRIVWGRALTTACS